MPVSNDAVASPSDWVSPPRLNVHESWTSPESAPAGVAVSPLTARTRAATIAKGDAVRAEVLKGPPSHP